MKKIMITLALLFTGFTLASCQGDKDYPDIVTSMYTHYDLASQIVGDKMTVDLLVPLGMDIHTFEASSKDMVNIYESKLFIYTSPEIDQWLKNIDEIEKRDTIVLDMSKSYILEEHHHLQTDQYQLLSSPVLLHDDHDDHDDHHDDLHYWVDPTTIMQMIDYILDHIIIIDPENAIFYEENASNYKTEIYNLHLEIDQLLSHEPYKDSTLYFAGHNAMGAFASRYHIHIESLFSEFKPDDDLTSNEIINFSNLVISAQTHYLFTEALIEPRAAIAIKESLESKENYSLTLLELHTYHNVNQSDWEANVTYKELLERNFNNIKLALGIIESND